MSVVRIALANIRIPGSREESVALTENAIADAAAERAEIICFPECFIPGYRSPGKPMLPPNQDFLETAWARVSMAAAKANVAVVLGTERVVEGQPRITALVMHRDGTLAGFQDKVQLDPSEVGPFFPGAGRRVFQSGPLTFGVVICHEGWRYPETVRYAAREGAQIVFHPHFGEAEPGSYRPVAFADPANTFHEKAALCRAAENTCWFATVNCASDGSPTTSAVVRPDGTLLCYQPYGKPGLLIADIDLSEATGLLAKALEAWPMRTDFKSVDEYLAAQPEAARRVLARVRAAIRQAVPKADEVISYKIPTYKLGGTAVLYFAGWKRHYSLYPASQRLLAAFETNSRLTKSTRAQSGSDWTDLCRLD